MSSVSAVRIFESGTVSPAVIKSDINSSELNSVVIFANRLKTL